MSRTYARVKVSIWTDDDFRDLDDTAQALYLRLLSAPTMTLAGVCDWRPKRLAMLTKGMTQKTVEKAGETLEQYRYVFLDPTTDEALVRTFVKHENIVVNPKTAAGLAAAFAKITSARLRLALSLELSRLRLSDPDLKGWEHLTAPLGYASDHQSDIEALGIRLAIGSPIGTGTDRVSDRNPILLKPVASNHQPSTTQPSDSADEVFEEFWKAYPKKVGKGHAIKAWKAAAKKEEPQTIISAARLFAESMRDKDPQYIAHPSTWLNAERWADEETEGPAAMQMSYYTPPPPPDDFPEDMPGAFKEWNLACHRAHNSGEPIPKRFADVLPW